MPPASQYYDAGGILFSLGHIVAVNYIFFYRIDHFPGFRYNIRIVFIKHAEKAVPAQSHKNIA